MTAPVRNAHRMLVGGKDGKPTPALFDTNAPPIQLSNLFPYQTAFDAALQAIGAQQELAQLRNNPIVESTQRVESMSGYSVGLSPDSQAPVAIRFRVGGQGGNSQVLIIRPGEIIRPVGRVKQGESSSFNGFDWGLPFGWLGGGSVCLYVFGSPEAELRWNHGATELMFQSQQMVIRAANIAPPANLRNWPVRFPWVQNYRGVAGAALEQTGQPVLTITKTTRVMLRLRTEATEIIANGADNYVRVVFWGTDELEHPNSGLLAAGAAGLSQQYFYDTYFPGNNTAAIGVFHDPAVFIPPDFAGLGSDWAGVTLEAPAGSPLIDMEVDVLRWGLLG